MRARRMNRIGRRRVEEFHGLKWRKKIKEIM